MSGSMYLGAVYFDGDPGELLPAYQRMLDTFGLEALDVHLCITTDAGLTVFDACPDQGRSTRSSSGARRSWGAIAEGRAGRCRGSGGLGDIQVAPRPAGDPPMNDDLSLLDATRPSRTGAPAARSARPSWSRRPSSGSRR